MRTLLALGCLLLIAGCTQQGWQKPMDSAARVQSDLAACSEMAQRDAVTAAPHALGPNRLRVGRTEIANPAEEIPQELLVQPSLRNHCMRERGYDLLPQAARLP